MIRRNLGIGLSVSLLVFGGFEIYHSTGMVHTTKKPGSTYNGCFCHGETPSSAIQVVIEGPESLGTGEVGTYLLHVIKDTNVAAGINVATFFGDLIVGDSLEQQILESELTHSVPKFSSDGDSVSWVFHYRAPEVSLYDTLYAVGNSVNMNLDPEGDVWNFSENFIVRVGTPTNVVDRSPLPAHIHLYQNYPNPFNPSTNITYAIARRMRVRLSVFDINGRLVEILWDGIQDAGRYHSVFDASRLSSGVYVYRLDTESLSRARKMVVMK